MFVNVTEVFEAKIRKKMRNLQFYALGKKFSWGGTREISHRLTLVCIVSSFVLFISTVVALNKTDDQ